MNEIENIKSELISLYNSLKDVLPFSDNDNIKNSKENISSLSLIKEIKELLLNNKSLYLIKELEDNYHQLENQLKKTEYDSKYYLSEIMFLQIQNASLEIKLCAYMNIEHELNELKSKVKFEEGRFLENERKDNEIIILRKENSTIKKRLMFLEFYNKKYEEKKKDYKEKIKKLENIIQNLNKKISLLEKIKLKNNETRTRNLLFFNNNKTIYSSHSKIDLKSQTNNDIDHFYTKLDNQNNISIKTFRNNSNHKDTDIRNLSNIYSSKNDYFLIENHNNKSNFAKNNKVFDVTFNNIINKFNNNKKIKLPFKKEFTDIIKNKKNKSISRKLNHDTDDNKTLLYNLIL